MFGVVKVADDVGRSAKGNHQLARAGKQGRTTAIGKLPEGLDTPNDLIDGTHRRARIDRQKKSIKPVQIAPRGGRI